MKFKILDSFGKSVGILEVEKKIIVKEGSDLFKKILFQLFKEGVKQIVDTKIKKNGSIQEIPKLIKRFNLLNIGLVENYLISKGYTMEEIE